MDRETYKTLRELDALNEECDELVERAREWRERPDSSQLIYKEFHGQQPMQSQQQTFLDDESSARWNSWLNDALERESEELLAAVGEALAEERSATRDQMMVTAFETTKRQTTEILDQINARLDDIESRLDALEGNGNGGYSG